MSLLRQGSTPGKRNFGPPPNVSGAMRKLLALAALVAAGAGTALAATDRDTLLRYRISFSNNSGGRMTGMSVNFFVPKAWQALRPKDKRHLSFHEGRPICRYTVTFTTRQAADTPETPVEHVTKAVPAAGAAYLLDYGQRGSSTAWRVVRVKTAGPSGTQVRLRAMRADHRSIGSGAHKWQETVVTAASRKGGECHSGTYREVLGPQIGNALATAGGRAYDFAARS